MQDTRCQYGINEWIGKYAGELNRHLRSRLASAEDAQDIAQEACLRMLRANPASIENRVAYLYRIAHNLVYQHYRNRSRQGEQLVEVGSLVSPALSLEELTAKHARKQKIEKAMQELPIKCRMALVMRWRDGLRVAEIAERMSLSQGMVKKYLATGLAHFRKRLNRYVLADQAVYQFDRTA